MKNITKKECAKNMNSCLRFNKCSAPICPLDYDTFLRVDYPEDDICPFCRRNTKKGIRKSMPKELRKLVPDYNVKYLRNKNQ